jgi:membrane protease YdiL (CAAX protease family)
MENMNRALVQVIALTLIASLLPDILARESVGSLPAWWYPAKLGLLSAGTLYISWRARDRNVAGFGFLLIVITVLDLLQGLAGASAWWKSIFPPQTFQGQFGGSVLLKLLGIIPVLGVLLLLYGPPREVFLVPGDLSTRASRIGWLGISGGRISWGKLSVISALLISAGTLALTLFTVTGTSLPAALERLPSLLPLIILLALVNSFSEGVLYRSSVLGPLKEALPKEQLLLVAAAFFGIAHYYGAPRGIVGVIMSGVLGWYMCRSMYETRGFLTAWIIHFFQDVVIFSTVAVLGGF